MIDWTAVELDLDDPELSRISAELEYLAEDWHGDGHRGYMRCRRRYGAACERCRKGRAVSRRVPVADGHVSSSRRRDGRPRAYKW